MSTADLIFVGAVPVAVLVVVVLLWGKGAEAFRKASADLREHGFVVTHARERNRGAVTLVWGRYPAPVPFYLHISNRDLIAAAAGTFGIADIAIGDEEFDRRFVVRSNRPDLARAFLTRALVEELRRHESLQFLTTSIGNVFSTDYWPELKTRDRRDIWMLRTDGALESPQVDRYVELARRLAVSLEAFCKDKAFDRGSEVSGAFEGR